MSGQIRALIALDSGVDKEAIQNALPVDSRIHVVGVVEGLEEGWKTLQETQTDLLVVASNGYSDRVVFLVESATKEKPDRPVVVLSSAPQNGYVERLFQAGADDVVTLDDSPGQIAFSLSKAVARKLGGVAAGAIATSPLVCILGPKGGTGKTVTACNLAVALAQKGEKVVIVDLDLQFGDIGLSLGLQPEKTIFDLSKSGGSLDADKIEAYLARHESGVRALLAPTRPDHASVITVEFLREVYAVLRASNDFVIVDTPPGFTPEVIATIDVATHVCVVGMLDSLSLKNTKLGLETLDLMGYDSSRVRLVLNRSGSKVGITGDDVVTIVGRAPDVFVPSDRDISRSVNEGAPIVASKQRSDAAKAFRQLADFYRPAEENARTHKRGLLGRRKK